MREYKFRVCQNPFGVIYNPLSISENLMSLARKNEFTADDLSFHNELWFSYSHYTLFSDPDQKTCLDNINREFRLAKDMIADSEVLFITLGTSWVFRKKESEEIVSNCHKVPASHFDRFFSSAEQSAAELSKAIQTLRELNPELKVVCSVSPVRHWKDGAIENQRSKSALILAIAALQQKVKDVYYFPAYEIFMDELRDYRFYGPDRFHPSEEALAYIWQKFLETFIEPADKKLLDKIQRVLLSLKHRPRFPGTKAHEKFRTNHEKNIRELLKSYPFLDFSKELSAL
jgi:hypothetical protein